MWFSPRPFIATLGRELVGARVRDLRCGFHAVTLWIELLGTETERAPRWRVMTRGFRRLVGLASPFRPAPAWVRFRSPERGVADFRESHATRAESGRCSGMKADESTSGR